MPRMLTLADKIEAALRRDPKVDTYGPVEWDAFNWGDTNLEKKHANDVVQSSDFWAVPKTQKPRSIHELETLAVGLLPTFEEQFASSAVFVHDSERGQLTLMSKQEFDGARFKSLPESPYVVRTLYREELGQTQKHLSTAVRKVFVGDDFQALRARYTKDTIEEQVNDQVLEKKHYFSGVYLHMVPTPSLARRVVPFGEIQRQAGKV